MALPLIIECFRRRPGMFMESVLFDSVVAFLNVYDAAQSAGFLRGFREWLLVRANRNSNLAWSGIVLIVLNAKHDSVESIEGMFALLEEFVEARDPRDGLRKIYIDYECWLRSKTWYTPDSPEWLPLNETAVRPPRKKKAHSNGGRSRASKKHQ